jgi:hypothetical protein
VTSGHNVIRCGSRANRTSGTHEPPDEGRSFGRGGERGEAPSPAGIPAGEDATRASEQSVGRGLKRLSRYGFASESCPRMAPSGNGRLWMFT